MAKPIIPPKAKAPKAPETGSQQPVGKKALEDVKNVVEIAKTTSQELGELSKKFNELSTEEKAGALAKIASGALVSYLMLKLNEDSANVSEFDENKEVTGDESEETQELPPKVEGWDLQFENRTDLDLSQARTTGSKDVEVIAEDHRNNAKQMALAPGYERMLREDFLEIYEENREKYEEVAQATDLPPMLIAALHYRESSMNFNRYMHNGDPLGSATTHVPAGILFGQGQWVESAIHALGGEIKDNRGRSSLTAFRDLKESLGLTADSTDLGAMMAFAERYNGLGYRFRGNNVRSPYVYAGTNLNTRGMYVADHQYDPNKRDMRLGVGAMCMSVLALDRGEKIAVAPSQSGRRPSMPPGWNMPKKAGQPLTGKEKTAGVGTKAKQVLSESGDRDFGYQETFTENGVEYVAQVEPHYDAEKGWHRGVTVYKK
jgi:lysozyme family protein